MADILEKKTERSKAKQAVTVASRLLVGAVRHEADEKSLNCLVLELENAFDDFCSINEEFEVLVLDEEFSEHRVVNGQDINTYSTTVRQVYENAMAEFMEKKASRLQMVQNAQAAHIKSALTRSIIQIQELISAIQENLELDTPNIEALKQDEYELNRLSDEIWDNMFKLNSEKGEEDMQQEVNVIQRTVCGLKRDINKCLNRGPNTHASYSESAPSINFSSPGFSPIAHGSNLNQTHTISTSSNHNIFSFGATPSQSVSTQGSLQSPAGTPIVSQTWSTPRRDDGLTSIYSTRDTTYPYAPTPLVTPAQWWPRQSIPDMKNAYSYVNPSFHNTAHTPLAPAAQVRAQYPVWSPLQNYSGRTSSTSDIQLKKISLPTFSGLRKDWAEFKTVWKQLAENTYSNKTALAHELKRSVKGEASLRIRSVYVTKPEAYEIMWKKLEAHYEDPTASVQAALDDLSKLKPIKEEDYKGLVAMVDEVESTYSQLEELNHLNTLTMRDVDFVSSLLPRHLRVDWARKYHDLPSVEKLHPFISFMRFLEREREAVTRLAEKQPSKGRVTEISRNAWKGNGQAHHTESKVTSQAPRQYYKCAYPSHRKDAVKHCTEECKEFQKLPIGGKEGKFELLKQINACFVCFGDHKRQMCPNKKTCSKCGSDKHHVMLCKSEKQEESPQIVSQPQVKGDSHVSRRDYLALYPIQQVKVWGIDKSITVFCDSGSNTTYITHRAADKIKAQRLNKYTLDVTTMGNVETTYDTVEYQFTLKTVTGKKVDIRAYGMEKITGPVSRLDLDTLSELFPQFDSESLQRRNTEVDVLLGCDYFGLHPKKEEANSGENLSVMSGELGICLQGAHPRLKEETGLDSNLAKIIHNYKIKTESHHAYSLTHEEFQPRQVIQAINRGNNKDSVNAVYAVEEKKREPQVENFIRGEELGTETTPRCGGCRCNKCPTVGHTYSFQEEQELKLIRENLEYDEERQCWITGYPWLTDPSTLPNNYNSALATLNNTENTLRKDKKWADTYQQQMQDMVDRGVARKLTSKENSCWQGPVFYISHLAVVNPRSHSTPVRIVFNSSQVSKGVSLNSCLAKGPDSYMNNLLGILLRWREEQVAVVGDIKKMFNSVLLKPLEQHCHRFLWRNLQTERDPDEYVIQRVNMGDKPAPAISNEALYKTAERFENDSPAAAMWTIGRFISHKDRGTCNL